MTTPRDTERLLRAYLDEGTDELPLRAYDAVREQIERTRQRVVIGPRKEPLMPVIARFVVVAALVVLAAALGVSLLAGGPPARQTSPTSLATTGPTVNPTTVASADPTPSMAAYRWPTMLDDGSYQTDFAYDLPVQLRFTVGSGWEGRDISLDKGGRLALRVLVVDQFFADACGTERANPPIGATVDAVAAALAAAPALDATAPVPVTLGGRPATSLTTTLRQGLPCAPDDVRILEVGPLVCDAGCSGLGPAQIGGFELAADEQTRNWVVDDGSGRAIVIQAISVPAATAEELAELQAVVDSLELVPAP